MSSATKKQAQPTIIKKYANRRLYDTGRSGYITLEDLCEMVKEGHDFVVVDAKSGEDITRQVLTQIIVDQEGKGAGLLPLNFLKELIGYYGDSLETVVPDYLEQSINEFSKHQDEFRAQVTESVQGMMAEPMSTMEEIGRKNMEMFENAMKVWSPFSVPSPAATTSSDNGSDQKVAELKKTIQAMQEEIDRLLK